MSFITQRRTIGFKKETEAYTPESLEATDYDLCAYDISYDPEIAMMARKCARGDFSKDTSIAGKRSITITFSHALQYTATPDLGMAPNYFKCLECCGMKQDTYDEAGVSLTTNSDYSAVPATIEIVEKDEGAEPSQVVIKAHGCMGNARLVLDSVGQPIRIEFEFKGVLNSIADRAFGSILNPTGFDTELPDAVLSSSLTMFNENQQIDTCTIDLGNDVQLFTDPAKSQGIQGAHIIDRNPTMELDPDLELIADQGDYARWTGNTTGAYSMTVGDNLTISAPVVQYIKAYVPGDREGHVTNTKSMELKRLYGNDELTILQGATC